MDSVAAGSDYCCEDCSIDHVHSVDVAEPFRFNFEISWEVAHKGKPNVLYYYITCFIVTSCTYCAACNV